MNVREQLNVLGVRPSKRRGQNFLIDRNFLEQILRFASLDSSDAVLEIGPGLGVLSARLAEKAGRLALVELEPAFCSFLKEEIPNLKKELIIQADIREQDGQEIAKLLGSSKFTVVSNLPYSISTEVVLWLLKNRMHIKSAILLLQQEYARRIAAQPGGRSYGSITVLRSLYAHAELGAEVPGTAFYPAAGVKSQLLRLDFADKLRASISNESLFRAVVRAAFGQRRKTLANAVNSGGFFRSKTEVEDVLKSCEIDPRSRAETLSLEQFALISNKIDLLKKTEGQEALHEEE